MNLRLPRVSTSPRRVGSLLACAVLCLSAGRANQPLAAPLLQWTTEGLVGPESAVYDATRNEIYVSNMGTYGKDAVAKDGFIARLSSDGKILQQHWVNGLENPKGLALSNGHLFVGDDVYLTEIDVASGKIVAQFKPEGSDGDFNDCTADPAGNVYVCSGKLHTVFRLHQGKFEAWVVLDPAVTGGINGLRAEKDRLLLGGWSRRTNDGKEELGHLSTIDYRNKKVGRVGTKPICHIDGLEPDGGDGYVVSDWLTGEVFHITADGEKKLLLELPQGAADLTHRIESHQLLIPLMKDNQLRAYSWRLE